jgi:hypothetical protein
MNLLKSTKSLSVVATAIATRKANSSKSVKKVGLAVVPRVLKEIPRVRSLTQLNCLKWEAEFSFISYGVRIGIRVNEARLLERLPDYLPPGWEHSASPDVDQLYSLIGDESNYQLWRDREILAEDSLLENILHTLDTDLRLQIGMLVQDRLFVHAGVVGWRGEAVLALLDNTIVARTRPEFALSILPGVVSPALRIAGKRGEAAAVAVALLRQLDDWIECSKVCK